MMFFCFFFWSMSNPSGPNLFFVKVWRCDQHPSYLFGGGGPRGGAGGGGRVFAERGGGPPAGRAGGTER